MASKNRRSIKTAKIICAQCRLEVVEEKEENIQCDKFSKTFHSLCTNLDKRQYEYLLENESEQYVCHLCENKSGGSLKEELKEIKTKLNQLDQLRSITEAIDFMSKQYDALLKGIAENNKKMDLVQKENKVLKNEIATLKTSVKILNNQRVKNDCIIRGIETNNDLKAVETVLKITKQVGIDLKEESIEDAYFFKKKGDKNNNKQTMVVKFNNKRAKDYLMMSKSKLKENDATKSVYVNDYLSKETLSLFNAAKDLKCIGYSSVYTTGSRVFVKKNEISKPRLIRDVYDVDEIMSEGATMKSKRRSMNREVAVDAVAENISEDDDGNGSAFLSPV